MLLHSAVLSAGFFPCKKGDAIIMLMGFVKIDHINIVVKKLCYFLGPEGIILELAEYL